jgi:hypothetical protein
MLNNFIFYDFVYEKSELIRMREFCERSQWSRIGNTTENSSIKRFFTSSEVVLDTGILIGTYLKFIPELPASCLDEGFSKSGGCLPDVKLARYDAGDYYEWHCDCWETHKQALGWKRQLSSITYLNDNYEGGETEFDCGKVIKPEMGKTLIFPSSWLFPHRGRKVTKGTKYIYINHVWT